MPEWPLTLASTSSGFVSIAFSVQARGVSGKETGDALWVSPVCSTKPVLSALLDPRDCGAAAAEGHPHPTF